MMLLHVRYVAPEGADDVGSLDVLRQAFASPSGAAFLALSVLALVVYGWATTRWGRFAGLRSALGQALAGYTPYLPWILRLSAGIALVGAALSGFWFVPTEPLVPRSIPSLLLLVCGFGLLLGVAVPLLAGIALLAWLYALLRHGADVLFAAEVAGALVALLFLSAGRPSLDDLLSRSLPAAPAPLRRLGALRRVLGPRPDAPLAGTAAWAVPWALRTGLGLAFLSAGLLEKLLDPGPALATAGQYGLDRGPLSAEAVVVSAGLVEVLLGLALLLGIAPRAFAALGFAVLTFTLFALPDDPVLAHVSLWGVASAVFVLGNGRRARAAGLEAPEAGRS